MGFESPNNSPREKPDELTFDSIDVPGQRPYKTGDFVSVLRSSGDIEGGWIIEDINAKSVSCVGSIDGGLVRKTMSLDIFKDIQIKAGDKRSHARLVDRQLEQIRANISVRKEIKRLEAVKIDSVESAKKFLHGESAYKFRNGDSYDYLALWNFVYNDLKNKIRSFREEFGEDSAPYNLTALRMRKMNEVHRLLWPTIDQKQEYSGEKRVVKVEDVEKLIISERSKKSNAPSMWSKILELYGIKKSRNAKRFDESKSIVGTGLPFKIENTSNGLILVWPAVGDDFAFFSQLGEKDTHKLAEKLDILIKRALAG